MTRQRGIKRRLLEPCITIWKALSWINNALKQLHLNLKMSNLIAASCESQTGSPEAQEKKPLKPCCACPETKQARDSCIIEKGEENCQALIEAHKECMRALGFKV
ncbi:cytochrome c oxidase copper chaperone isoform X2 [Rhinatrema bivittatum]|uniref:cytochrome c oxidase copper chaperone isoform X2 n=1 Tax=Rhinatrema bivittatum TaxID=194408 RepID=UPI00112A4807|nr:cytochrome c oxidase copper chaperone isoform X2 [Rhinatrema bivittatum]